MVTLRFFANRELPSPDIIRAPFPALPGSGGFRAGRGGAGARRRAPWRNEAHGGRGGCFRARSEGNHALERAGAGELRGVRGASARAGLPEETVKALLAKQTNGSAVEQEVETAAATKNQASHETAMPAAVNVPAEVAVSPVSMPPSVTMARASGELSTNAPVAMNESTSGGTSMPSVSGGGGMRERIRANQSRMAGIAAQSASSQAMTNSGEAAVVSSGASAGSSSATAGDPVIMAPAGNDIKTPLVYEDPSPALTLNDAQKAQWKTLQDQFATTVAPDASAPVSAPDAKTWKSAQISSDQIFRALYGIPHMCSNNFRFCTNRIPRDRINQLNRESSIRVRGNVTKSSRYFH